MSAQAKASQAKSVQTMSTQVKPGQVKSGDVVSAQVKQGQVKPVQVTSCLAIHEGILFALLFFMIPRERQCELQVVTWMTIAAPKNNVNTKQPTNQIQHTQRGDVVHVG